MRIMDTIKRLFQNQFPAVVAAADKRLAASLNLGDALVQPGRGAQKPEVPMPAVVPAPAVIAPTPAPVIAAPAAAPYCPTCGQCLPPTVAAAQDVPQPVAIAESVVATQTPLDAEWNAYERNDLPPRTSSQIQILLPLETEELRTRRIISDKMRYAHQQGR